MIFNKIQVEATFKSLGELADLLDKHRVLEAKASIVFEKSKEQLITLGRRKIMTFRLLPEFEANKFRNLVSGEFDEEREKAALDEALENDMEFIEAWGRNYDLQEAYYVERAKVLAFFDKLSATRSQARLISATLEYLADEEQHA